MKGMNDYLPGDMRLREYVIGQIKSPTVPNRKMANTNLL